MSKKTGQIKKVTAWFCISAALIFSLAMIAYMQRNFKKDIASSLDPIYTARMSPRFGFIEIDFGDGSRRRFQGDLDNMPYPLRDTLLLIAKEGGLRLDIENGKIKEIGGVGGSGGEWRVYQKGSPRERNLEELNITGGEEYLLRYER